MPFLILIEKNCKWKNAEGFYHEFIDFAYYQPF